MWTTVLVIALVVCLAVGPIMMVQPSKRDSRLAKLRGLATSKGLRVRLSTDFDTDNTPVAIYSLPWPVEYINQQRESIHWVLRTLSYEHEAHFSGKWDWYESKAAPEKLHRPVSHALNNMPAGVLSLGSNLGGLECAWRENAKFGEELESVNRVYGWLNTLLQECCQEVLTAP